MHWNPSVVKHGFLILVWLQHGVTSSIPTIVRPEFRVFALKIKSSSKIIPITRDSATQPSLRLEDRVLQLLSCSVGFGHLLRLLASGLRDALRERESLPQDGDSAHSSIYYDNRLYALLTGKKDVPSGAPLAGKTIC